MLGDWSSSSVWDRDPKSQATANHPPCPPARGYRNPQGFCNRSGGKRAQGCTHKWSCLRRPEELHGWSQARRQRRALLRSPQSRRSWETRSRLMYQWQADMVNIETLPFISLGTPSGVDLTEPMLVVRTWSCLTTGPLCAGEIRRGDAGPGHSLSRRTIPVQESWL